MAKAKQLPKREMLAVLGKDTNRKFSGDFNKRIITDAAKNKNYL